MVVVGMQATYGVRVRVRVRVMSANTSCARNCWFILVMTMLGRIISVAVIIPTHWLG